MQTTAADFGARAPTAQTTVASTEAEDTSIYYTITLQPRPRVTWEEDIVDNERLGRKKSKKCCIFHKTRQFGESSSESSSYSESCSSDEEGDATSASAKRMRRRRVVKEKDKQKADCSECGHHHHSPPENPSRQPPQGHETKANPSSVPAG